MGNPMYCTLAEARDAAAKLKDIGGGVRYIYLPVTGSVVMPDGTTRNPGVDYQNPERKQYLFITKDGNTEQVAGIWHYQFSRMPAMLVRWIYGGTVEPGNGKPVVGVSWKEEFRG